MSMGLGGFAELVMRDDKTLFYSYGGFNLNDGKYGNAERISDGEINHPAGCAG